MMLGQHVRTTMGQRWPNIVMLSGYIHTFLVEYNGLEVTEDWISNMPSKDK